MNRFYRDRMDAHFKKMMHLVPASLYQNMLNDYQCVYQEIRNEVCGELKRMSTAEGAVHQRNGAMEEKRRIAGLLGLSEAFDE